MRVESNSWETATHLNQLDPEVPEDDIERIQLGMDHVALYIDADWIASHAAIPVETRMSPAAFCYRVIKNYPDLEVRGESVHLACLKHLISIEKDSEQRVNLYREMLARFPDKIDMGSTLFMLGQAYEKLGEIQGGSNASLGDTAGAVSSYRAALGIRETLLAGEPKSATEAESLATCLESLAGILGRAGNADESFGLAQRALVVRERLLEADPKSRVRRRGLARAHFFLSQEYSFLNRPRDQIAEMEKARDIYEALAVEDPKDPNARRSVALTYKSLASARSSLGEKEMALEGYRKSEAIERELVASDPANALYKRDLSHSYGGVGEVLFLLGRVAEGAESYRKAIAIRKALADADPKNAEIRAALARGYVQLGRQQANFGDPRAALESVGQAIPICGTLAASDPGNASKVVILGWCYSVMGFAHERIAKKAPHGSNAEVAEWRRAQASFLKARDVFEDLERQGKLTPQMRADLDEVNAGLKRVGAALDPKSAPE